MSDKPDPGVGWRLLEIGEVIEPSDQFFSCGGGWRTVVSVSGERFHPDDQCPIRRSTTKDSTQGDRTSAELARLQSENADLREQLDKARFEIVSLSIDKRSLQDDLDAASAALRDLGCAQGEIDDDIAQCIHDLATRWRTGMTEQRACEIVNQMRRDGRLDVSDESCGWFTPVGPENWQCRPAQPKPVTLTVTCPPDKREAVEAAIKAAGGRV